MPERYHFSKRLQRRWWKGRPTPDSAAMHPKVGKPPSCEAVLMGIDLAWISERNGSGIAVGALQRRSLRVRSIQSGVKGLDAIRNVIAGQSHLSGVAIDAPLIIENSAGMRRCEKALSAVYSRKWASCYPSNIERYPDASSVHLAQHLFESGYTHMGLPADGKWQVECYPHPAIIELFGLDKRLPYKKGDRSQKRAGQLQLADYLLRLADSARLSLQIEDCHRRLFDPDRIRSLSGQGLKDNEDALDAVVCLYIAGLYALSEPVQVFGDTRDGYIVVPKWSAL